ncbi:MAG: hypothetical protein LIP11_19040 [Clostridiales bacterium]|nr:hypothetical protein [Clostridiales bacterium]
MALAVETAEETGMRNGKESQNPGFISLYRKRCPCKVKNYAYMAQGVLRRKPHPG